MKRTIWYKEKTTGMVYNFENAKNEAIEHAQFSEQSSIETFEEMFDCIENNYDREIPKRNIGLTKKQYYLIRQALEFAQEHMQNSFGEDNEYAPHIVEQMGILKDELFKL